MSASTDIQYLGLTALPHSGRIFPPHVSPEMCSTYTVVVVWEAEKANLSRPATPPTPARIAAYVYEVHRAGAYILAPASSPPTQQRDAHSFTVQPGALSAQYIVVDT